MRSLVVEQRLLASYVAARNSMTQPRSKVATHATRDSAVAEASVPVVAIIRPQSVKSGRQMDDAIQNRQVGCS